MSLRRDFHVLITDEEFRKLLHEALYGRSLLEHCTSLVVDRVYRDRNGMWRIVCEKPKEATDAK